MRPTKEVELYEKGLLGHTFVLLSNCLNCLADDLVLGISNRWHAISYALLVESSRELTTRNGSLSAPVNGQHVDDLDLNTKHTNCVLRSWGNNRCPCAD